MLVEIKSDKHGNIFKKNNVGRFSILQFQKSFRKKIQP
jgi:hypothetical protein